MALAVDVMVPETGAEPGVAAEGVATGSISARFAV
jgi:hypothetical protein